MSVDEQARTAVSEHVFIDAIGELRPGLYRDAYRRLGDSAAADDAVQETLIRAFRAAHRLRHDSDLAAWTHTILRNVCRNEYGRRARDAHKTVRISGDPLMNRCARPGVETELGLDRNVDLGAVLDALPDNYREVLELRFIDDLEYGEIAAEIGVTEVNARARVSRARAAARGAFRAIAAVPFLIAGLIRRGDRKAAALEKAVGASSTPASVDPSLPTRIGTLAQPAVEAVNTASSSASGMSAVAKAAVGVTAVATVGVGVATDTNPLDVVPNFDAEPAAVVAEPPPEEPVALWTEPPSPAAGGAAPVVTPGTDPPAPVAVSTTIAVVAEPATTAPETTTPTSTSAADDAVEDPVEADVVVDPVVPANEEAAADQPVDERAVPSPPPGTVAPTTATPTTTVSATTTVPARTTAAVALGGLTVTPAGPRVDIAGGVTVDSMSGSVSGRLSFEPADERFRLDATLELTLAGEWIELRLAGFTSTDGTTPGAMSGVFRSSSTKLPASGEFTGTLDLTSGTVTLSLNG